MKNILSFLLPTAIIVASCSSANTTLFGKKTPLEKYEERLKDDGLQNTAEGRQWQAASDSAFHRSVVIQLPYRHTGAFSAVKPQALALSFPVKQGEQLHFLIKKDTAANFVLYAELYKQEADGNAKLLQAIDTNTADFSQTITETGTYILKLQPQLFRVGRYSLSIATGPSLFFPVADKKAYIGSVWGDARDGGQRSHEGVDIFAPKRTPAVAAADGFITGVREGGIGGKTVWLRPNGQNVTLYYAHLDEQWVQEGQAVKKGDTVGLVGNTGNAAHTPSHLHFGVYGSGGALNPFPFVNRTVSYAPALPAKNFSDYLRLRKDLKTETGTTPKNSLLLPLAITANGYLAELPDGRIVQLPSASVQEVLQPIKKTKALIASSLYAKPADDASAKATVSAGSVVSILGYFNQYVYVQAANQNGWVLFSSLEG